MKILTYPTQAEAQAALDAIDAMAADWFEAQGAAVDRSGARPELIARNAASGYPEPQATRTVTWSKIWEAPTDPPVFYIASLTDGPAAWADWRSVLEADYGHTAPADIVRPAEWTAEPE